MAAKGDTQSNTKIEMRPGAANALVGTLPFVLFGIVCTLTKLESSLSPVYLYTSFFLAVLVGLVIGLVKDFPSWTYSYLGWSIVMAWWWMMMPMDSFSGRYDAAAHHQMIAWRSWLVLLCAVGAGLLLARSTRPIRQMIGGIREDWTLLSFMIYAFVAFTELIYDENHHPYLVLFILGSTLAISLGAWFYLRNNEPWKRIISLLFGFIFAYLISYACYATWDWAAYHGYPESPPEAWYTVLRNTVEIVLLWSVMMFWPVIFGLVQRSSRNRETT